VTTTVGAAIRPAELIQRKRDGGELSPDEIGRSTSRA
jgi:hypothetical protein